MRCPLVNERSAPDPDEEALWADSEPAGEPAAEPSAPIDQLEAEPEVGFEPEAAPSPPTADLQAQLDTLTRERDEERQRLQQERVLAYQYQQQQAWQGINQWLASLPEPERVQHAGVIQTQLNESVSKTNVLTLIAIKAGLDGEYRDEFFQQAYAMGDPLAVERAAQTQKRLQELSANPQSTQRARPGMALVRPDAGAPNGSRSGGRRSYQELIKPFMPGGPKQGKVQELEELLSRHGYR